MPGLSVLRLHVIRNLGMMKRFIAEPLAGMDPVRISVISRNPLFMMGPDTK